MNKTSRSFLVCGLLLVFALQPAVTLASLMDEEIDYLISAVGKGGCAFIRNGNKFTGRDARAHLKSKRRRNAHIIDSTEEFIEKIASQSATSGKPYLISCRGENQQNARDWFTAMLAQHRKP
jgi:hypothetical protein